MLTEYIAYLNEQLRQPYLWGGQHTKLTPENYKAVIAKKESKAENRINAEKYCEKMFAEGYTVLYAYDCSGLGCYWLYNLKHIYKCDVNANTMMLRCVDITNSDPPEKGWWVFRTESNDKATHIGYMIDNDYLIEAKGRKYGVVKTKFRSRDWSCWGIPKVFEDDIRTEISQVESENQESCHFVKVIKGKRVNVRSSDSKKGKILFTAHGNDEFPFISIAPSGWYCIETKKGPAYITNLEKYTVLI